MSDADRLREKLRDLRRAGDYALAPELHSRLAEHLKTHGPTVVRRSRRRRAWLKAGTLLLPIALGAGWAATRGLERGVESGAPDRAAEPALRASSGEARACARPLDAPSFTALPSGRRWIDLGARARVVLDEGGEAELDAEDPCHLELRLARGRVTVHAADLLGGEFRVRAAATDVVVHGTVFAVERTEQGVSVDVDEGRVLVERTGRAVAPLVRGGERLRVDNLHAPVLLALTGGARLQLRAALAEPPAQQTATRAEATRDGESGESTARSATSAVGTRPSQAPGALEPQIARPEIYRGTANGSATSRVARANRARAPASRALAQASDATRAADASAPTRGAASPTSAPARSSASVAQLPAGGIETGATTRSEATESRSQSASDAASPANARIPAPGPTSPTEPSPNARNDSETLGTAAREQPAAGPPPARESASAILARADGLWRRGERDEARTLYQRAGADSGPTAQAAWLALARRELSTRDVDAAREALASYTARFPNGALSEEAAGIEFRVALLDGDDTLAEKLASRLLDRHPGTPAAKAAARWLRARGATQ